MPSSQSLASSRKRREPLHPPSCGCEFELDRSRACKKQKKLDSIIDPPSHPINPSSTDSSLRRSSRLRGSPPAPVSPPRKPNPNSNKGLEGEKSHEKGKGKGKGRVSESPSSREWDSRLRPRGKKSGGKIWRWENVDLEPRRGRVERVGKSKLLNELGEDKEVRKVEEEEEVEIDDGFDNGISWARKSRRVARVRVSKSGDQVTGSSGYAQSDDGLLQGGVLKSNEEEEVSPLKDSGGAGGGNEGGIRGSARSKKSLDDGMNECQDLIFQEKTEYGGERLVDWKIDGDGKDLDNVVSRESFDSVMDDHVDTGNENEGDLGLDEKCTNDENFKSIESLSESKHADVDEFHIGMDNLPCENEKNKDEDTQNGLSSSTADSSDRIQAAIDPATTPTAFSTEKLENVGSHENMEDDPDPDLVMNCPVELENESPVDVPKSDLILSDKLGKAEVREGRRCGLCGGGVDGKPPKRLFQDSAGSDNEGYDGLSASEEPNYNVWDGFGDEPGWLGRLLGPIHDRYGIAGVWVHQHCAVWSPEVYFAGLGCLKNVRAALCRGRALKCSRCGRRGATIGCRVDRCPKTYHLPCARADGSIFDHRKFLIACADHLHLFQPQGNQYMRQIMKMKARKMKLDMRKLAIDAWRKDLETEEKWLENCGEDEEFLRREGKRLHRDILRIAPVYIGGSSDSEKLFQGWESVAGLQDVIRCMKEVVILPLLYPDFFRNLGLTPPRGVLLHGYPGTGKTLVVRALVGACSRGDKRIAYFARKGADCLGKYVGDAERQLRLLFQVAEKSQPSIIFFDEIDGLAPIRSRQQDQTHSSVVSTLLALLDGLKSRGSVMVIGATNRPEAVDPALRRPGRFDREIYFPLPSVKDRAAILALHTRKWPRPVSGSLLTKIAIRTPGFAGADLQALCTQAAMIALKRNCDLNKLLSAAEKYRQHGIHHSLPSFLVEERDWLTALACAPPPCSRREAGMAANHVVSSAIDSHLLPCLMEPLVELLVSLYLDHHIVLPPSLYKAAELIEDTLSFALKQKGISTASWWVHIRNLIQDRNVAYEIAGNLSRVGLLVNSSSYCTSDQLDVDNDDNRKNSGLHRLNPLSTHIRATSMHNSYPARKALGFRILIAGTPRSGQRHLASCVLHGFEGHIEIKKVDLATISQEGRGDMVQGVTRILLKCLNIGPCVVYMPRIDLWAIGETGHQSTELDTHESVKITEACAVENDASHAWNSLVEQVDSMSHSSLIILASYETTNHVLPLKIRQFFTSDVLNSTNPVPSKESISRFCVWLDGNFSRDAVIDASADKLSWDLAQRYVEMIHGRTHTDVPSKELKFPDTVKAHSDSKEHTTESRSASSKDDKAHRCENGDKNHLTSKTIGRQEDEIWLQSHQDSALRISMAKGKSTLQLAIATLGYQILRYPHFAELCWATSKLKDGPSTGINGPWKGWPFNSCIVHADGSQETIPVGEIFNQRKGTEQYSSVRGLIAVGLLAYRGTYKSTREVSFDIRKVLELLVKQINARILDRKDRRFFRLLSQVAYLEDIVTSWAYTIQSLEVNNRQSGSGPRSIIDERLNAENLVGGSSLVNDISCPTNMTEELKLDMHEHIPEKVAPQNNECADLNGGAAHLGLSNSDTWCSYDCCTECAHDLRVFTRKLLVESLESDGCCSTIDEAHDIVASCSTSLLAATSSLEIAKSLECNSHSRSKKTGSRTAFMISLFDPGLKVVCKDFEPVPSDPIEDVRFHCKLEHLCLSSLVEMFKINRPRG